MANINDFKAKLAGGGARANQFKVTMPFPGYAQVGGEIEDLAFLCRSTSLPGMTVPSFNVPFIYAFTYFQARKVSKLAHPAGGNSLLKTSFSKSLYAS